MPETHDPGLYDLFVSYSTKDNQPPPGTKVGWVYTFIQRLRELAKPFTSENVTTTGDADAFPDWDTFYAPDEIQPGHLWEPRLRTAVANSRVLLTCLSPNYWNSQWCKFEWETYLENESARGLANQVGGITPIYFVHSPGVNAADIIAQAPAWARDLLSARQVQLLDFTEYGQDLLIRLTALREDADVESRVKAIASRIAQQISHARRAERGLVGNIALGTDTFVGRQQELSLVENQLFGGGALGVITALRGIGGQGKTALALRYGQNLRSRYSGGCWQVGAELAKGLLPLLATLRDPLGLPVSLTEEEPATARRVLLELYRRAHDLDFPRSPGHPAAALLLLDNIDHAELLTAAERNSLCQAMREAGCGHDPGWLHILATTRLEAHELSFLPPQQIIPVDSLPANEALALWLRISGPLTDAESEAAGTIIDLIERHTLTVEIAARHIRRTLGETSLTYLARLQLALNDGPTRLARLLSGQEAALQNRDLPDYAHPLAVTLGFTFTHLAEEDPAAATVLHYAAHFPAEAVPLPWLRILAGQEHPELLAEPEAPGLPTAWDRAVLRLCESLRLLTPADAELPEVLHLHRLAGIYLRATAEATGKDSDRVSAVEQWIEQRCTLAEHDHYFPLMRWERRVLLADLTVRLAKNDCTNLVAQNGLLLSRILTSYTDLYTAHRLCFAAHEVMRRRIAIDRGNAVWQRDLAVSLGHLGHLAVAQGNLLQAQQFFGECNRTLQSLADSTPGNAALQRDLAVSYEQMGDLAKFKGNIAKAVEWIEKSRLIWAKLITLDPSNAAWQRSITVPLNKLGDLALVQGNLLEAERLFGNALRIAQGLADSGPGNAAWQRSITVPLNKLGDLAVAQGNLPEAQRFFGNAFLITQGMADSDPGNAVWQRDLLVSMIKLGDLAVSQGKLSEAQRLLGNALSITQGLVDSDSGNAAWQRDLSVSLNKQGDLAVAVGNVPEAQGLFSEALRIAQRLVDSDPENAAWQRDLSVSFERMGDLAVVQGILPEAERLFSETLGIRQRLADSAPGNSVLQRDLSVSLSKLGQLALAQGNLSAAQRLFGAALQIARRLAESAPGNVGWQRDLSVSLEKLGDLAVVQKDLPEGQRLFGAALQIRQRLAESGPGNVEWQRDVVVSHYKLAMLAREMGEDVESDGELRACFEILNGMRQRNLHYDPQMEQLHQQLSEVFKV